MNTPLLHVAVAAIRDDCGRVLIARRPTGVHQGDLWEFPGGKVEPGEDVRAALSRELWEELHIELRHCRPLIRIPFHYPDRGVLLDVWRVDAYTGTPAGREGQPIRWVEPEALPRYDVPAANRPIVTAVRLPDVYAISGDCWPGEEAAFLARLDAALERGVRLFQLRVRGLEAAAWRALAQEAAARVQAAGGQILVNGSPERALSCGADGVHLPARALASLQARPDLPWVAASCHHAEELAAAVRLGVDFAVLSPVQRTASHPDAEPMGWPRFAELVRDVPLPVYALGGLDRGDLEAAVAARAQGVAGIRGFWEA